MAYISNSLAADDKPKLLTPREVADILGIDPQTLNKWRCTKRYNLPYIRVGRLIRYREGDVQAFIAARTEGME
jgi:excisionase family DNA binding protein